MPALIHLLLSEKSVQLRPGGQTDLTLTVQNRSQILDRYQVTVEGIAASWVTISPAEIALFPEDQGEVQVTLHLPAGQAPAGHHDVHIQVVSLENPPHHATADLRLQIEGEIAPEVAEPLELELALHPQQQRGTTGGTFTLQIHNRSHSDLTIELEAADAEEDCSYLLDPPQLVLPAGQEGSGQLQVQSKTPPGEKARHHAFTVTARAAEAPDLTWQAQGEWEQLPLTFELTLSPEKQSGAKVGVFRLRVDNPGDTDLTVHLEVPAPEEECQFILDPPQLVVPAGQERTGQLQVQSPTPLLGEQARRYPFTVTARPAEVPEVTRQVQGEWEQVPLTFELTLHPQKQSGMTEGTFQVQLGNPGDMDLTVQLEVTSTEEGCQYTLDPPQLILPAGQEGKAQLQVQPQTPPGEQAQRYPFTVTARPAEAPELIQQVQGEWERVVPLTFELSLHPQEQRGTTGGAFQLQVLNPSDSDLTVQLEVTSTEEGCQYTLDPPRLVVPAGQERTVELQVRSQLPPGEQTRRYPFTVTARPAEDPELARQAQGRWVQLPLYFQLALSPKKQRGTTEGTFRVQVSNPGGVDLTVQLEAADTEEGCQYTFSPPQLVLPAGQEGTVQLQVRPTTATTEEGRHYPFTVTARPAEAPELIRQVQGEWEQIALTFELTMNPRKLRGLAEGTFHLQIGNPGEIDLTVQLEMTSAEEGCQYILDPPRLVVPAREKRPAQLQVQSSSPLLGEQARRYPFTVTARPAEAPEVTRQAHGEWEQVPINLELALHPQQQSGTTEGTFQVQIQNQSPIDLTVQLETTTPEEDCHFTVDPPQLVVPAGQERAGRLQIRPQGPPPEEEARLYPFTVIARPAEAPQLIWQAQGEWEQVTLALELTLSPQKQRGTTAGTFQIQVHNPGDSALTVHLEVTSTEEGCQYILDPPQFVVPAREKRPVQLQIRPTVPPPEGEARRHPFTVTARPAEAPDVTRQAHGEWEQVPRALELALSPQKQRKSTEGNFVVQIGNPGDTPLTVRLEAGDTGEGCWYLLDPPQAVVPPGQEQVANLRVRSKTPLSGEVARRHLFTVTARPAEAPELTRQVQGEWEQIPPTFELNLRPQRQSGIAEGVFSLQLHNPTATDLTVELEAADPNAACWYLVDPPKLVVPAGQEHTAQLRIRPKIPLSGSEGKTYAFTVTARPVEASELTRKIEGEWEQVPFTFELDLHPQKQSAAGQGIFTVQVGNPSSADLTIHLEAQDAEGSCQYTFSPAQVVVPAGQERSVQLQVQSKRPLRGKETQSYPFTVTARPAKAPHQARQVQGEWVQVPLTFELTLHPQSQSGASEGAFAVQLGNPGNTDLNMVLQLEAGDPQAARWDFVDRPQVVVPAGQERRVRLKVRPTSKLPGRVPQSHPFSVSVWPADAPGLAQQVQGEWVQTPAPRRIWGIVVLLLGLGLTFGAGLGAGSLAAMIVDRMYGAEAPLDISFLGWVCAGIVWAGGLVGSILLARKVWRKS